MTGYDFSEIEARFQKIWNFSAQNLDKPKYYVLGMFPYPSGKLHMGHLRNYVICDVIARFKRAKGFDVLHPMGWDAFGLPAENAAIEHKVHPKVWTEKNVTKMKESLKKIGLSYNWEKEIKTCDPNYYRHEQEFFIEFLKKGLAYKKKSEVNWDPVDNTVLANEQVVDGRGWRSGAKVQKKQLNQWFLKITYFADELLQDLDYLKNWPEKVITMQKNWIGKSDGAVINFKVFDDKDCYLQDLKIFTTRPETIFGASFCAIAPDHPLVAKLDIKVEEKILNCHPKSKDKVGQSTNLYVAHPVAEKKLPIYIANFVLAEYGTGAIFGCPAHDARDFEFAKLYNLKITSVIYKKNKENPELPYDLQDGIMQNSSWLNGMQVAEAKKSIIQKIEEEKIGQKKTIYKLRDWGVSRQRYWGCPIPVIYCKDCGMQPVDKKNLPVTLPEDVDFSKPGNPLDNHPTWKYTKCPKCGKDAVRDTDTFDTFFESSWYFAAFCNPKEGIDKKLCNHFLPVDTYVGGVEHAVMHLLYSRFFTKALKTCGYLKSDKTFDRLITQGMVCNRTYKDENGKWLFPKDAQQMACSGISVIVGSPEKMSKSKKNIVDPEEIICQYGADTARFCILSDNPPENDFEWSNTGVESSFRYLNKVFKLVENFAQNKSDFLKLNPDRLVQQKMHQILYDLENHIESAKLNSAIAKIHELTNLCLSNKSIQQECIPILVRVIEPFAPHLAEYMAEKIGFAQMLYKMPWPQYNAEFLTSDKAKIALQINGKFKKAIEITNNKNKEEILDDALKLLKISEYKKTIFVPGKVLNIIV